MRSDVFQGSERPARSGHALTRRRFLRLCALAGLGIASGTPLAACGSNAGVANKTSSGKGKSSAGGTLIVWGFQGTFEGIQSQIPKFEQRHPGVKASIKQFGYDDVHTNLLNAIVAGSGAPDLCAIDVTRLTQYVQGLADQNAHRQKYERQFVPPTVELASYKGKFYGLATDSEPMGFFYRRDLWDKYGTNPESIRTWDDLATAGDEVQRASGGKVNLYAMTANETSLYEVLAAEQGFGGYYFDDTDTKVIVDDPKIVEAVKVLKRLWDGRSVYRNPNGGYAGDEMTALLKRSKVASQIVAPGWYPETLKQSMPEQAGKWRMMRAPAVSTGGPRVGYQYPTIFVIPQQSSRQDLAWDLEVLGLTGAGARVLFDKYDILPAYQPLLNELMSKPDKYFGGQMTYRLWNEIAHDAPKVFFGTGFVQAQQIMGNHLQQVLTGKKTPEEGMQEAAQEMRAKLKKG